MTQESMIERVALAIDAALSREMEDDKPGMIDGTAMARAAIEAMREPTEEMVRAGAICDLPTERIIEDYQAMIAAALKPVPASDESEAS